MAGLLSNLAMAAGGAPKPKSIGLPPIPEGHVRLTHVMPDSSREILGAGEPFVYKKHGLGGTTDAYTDNDAIDHLAATGDPMFDRESPQPSAFSRNPFGNHMAIMDLPAEAHRSILTARGFDEPIPNAAIVGFVDRGSMGFQPNPRYDIKATAKFGSSAVERIRRALEEQGRLPLFGVPEKSAMPPQDVPALSAPSQAEVF